MKEIIQTMRSSIQDKWQRLMDNSGLTDKVQEIIPNAGSAFIIKSEESRIFRVINQLITGHFILNYMIAKLDNTKSDLCDACKVKVNKPMTAISMRRTERCWRKM